LTHLANLGARFMVHPLQYVVHMPHKKAATFKATKETGQWDRLFELYKDVRKEMSEGTFVPVTMFSHVTRLCPPAQRHEGGVEGAGGPQDGTSQVARQ
jgi:hypothetical protein